MEQFDILDKNGNPTGLTAAKGSALKPGQYYHGVHVYVFNRALEFLVQQRSYDKKFLPGGWDVVLEHTMAGESSVECAARGLREEIGLAIPENCLQFVYRLIWEEYSHIVDVYFLQLDFDISKLVLEEGKVIGAKAITKAEMLELVKNMYYRPQEYRQFIMNEINKI